MVEDGRRGSYSAGRCKRREIKLPSTPQQPPNPPRGNKNVTLSLSWNVVPNAGTLPYVERIGAHVVEFPDEYLTQKGM